MDYETLSVAELEQLSTDLKRQGEETRAERKRIADVRRSKLTLEKLATRLGVSVDGISASDAEVLLRLARTPKPGDVTVTPDTAVLGFEVKE